MVISVLLIQILFSLVLSINFNFVSIPLCLGESATLFFPLEMCCDYPMVNSTRMFQESFFLPQLNQVLFITKVHHIILFIIIFNYDILWCIENAQVLLRPYGLSVRKDGRDGTCETCSSPITSSVLDKGRTGILNFRRA